MSQTKSKIESRMDTLQNWLENNYHLENPEAVTDHIESISKFWSVLSEEDREYIQCAQYATEEGKEWNV